MTMNPHMRVLLASMALLVTFTQARAEEPANGSVGAIDDYIAAEMQKHHIPGASIAIVKDGKLVQAKGYGLANVELSVPATEKTAYQLASVTKTFTAAAIMLLVKDGKLGLEDKLTKKLSDLPSAWDAVTIRHLLSHTSGIKSYTSVHDFFKTARKDYTHREIIDLVSKDPLEFTPGEKWRYSNTGYFLLGMLIEKVSGQSYGEFLDARIFKPLDMTQTRVNELQAIIPNRAQGYSLEGKNLRNGEYVSPTQPFAAGALISTVNDLVKWDAALAGESLLKKSVLEKMWASTPLKGGGHANYGLGWVVDKTNDHRLISHGGGIPGFSTQLSRYVDDRLTVIVLTNTDNGRSGPLAQEIAGKFLPALAKKPDNAIADTDKETTTRLKNLLLAIAKGDIDPAMFNEESGKILVPKIKEGKDRFSALGALKTFQLLERNESAMGTRLRYRAGYDNVTLNVTVVLDKAGKVAGLLLLPEG